MNLERARNPKVADPSCGRDGPAVEEDICGLDVAMDEVDAVQMREATHHIRQDGEALAHGQRGATTEAPLEPLFDGPPFTILIDEAVGGAIRRSPKQRDDVWVHDLRQEGELRAPRLVRLLSSARRIVEALDGGGCTGWKARIVDGSGAPAADALGIAPVPRAFREQAVTEILTRRHRGCSARAT